MQPSLTYAKDGRDNKIDRNSILGRSNLRGMEMNEQEASLGKSV
jgi:hypothetical protein